MDVKEIRYSKNAIKFLKKSDRTVQERIIEAIEKLPHGNIKKLKGINGHKLRVGQYRVIFDNKGDIVDIIDINVRGKIYK